MNHDAESTQNLSKQEHAKTVDGHVRNRREPVKMTGLLKGLMVFVVFIILVYEANLTNNVENSSKILEETQYENSNPTWTYECEQRQCVRRLLKRSEPPVPLSKCNMMCTKPSLWPKPKETIVWRKSTTVVNKSIFRFQIHSPKFVEDDIKLATNLFIFNLPKTRNSDSIHNVTVTINVKSDERKLKLATNESYELLVKRLHNYIEVYLLAETFFGARHGLETLNQLIIHNTNTENLEIYHDIRIKDAPAFPHRGLMVDTARNFFPINLLKKVLDGMAMNKLNVFHLHLTDATSFPIELPTNPLLAKFGAYSSEMVYKPAEIRDLIEYARIRGIKVILEIDAPSHANAGWNCLNRKEDKVVICGESNFFNGHLNPDSKRTLALLQSVYSDLLELGTDRETFHIGGDEVDLNCLFTTKAASNYNDPYEFWTDYMNRIFGSVVKAFDHQPPENLVIWSSDLTDRNLTYLQYPKHLVIQYWFGQLYEILSSGNKIIFSTVGKWYLDCGFGSWKASEVAGSCDPYTPWQTFYDYSPWTEYIGIQDRVLGGEACLWSEQVGVDTLETRIWPRSAAFAERLWSDIPRNDLNEVPKRLADQRERLISRGLKVATIWPQWCSLNPGLCN